MESAYCVSLRTNMSFQIRLTGSGPSYIHSSMAVVSSLPVWVLTGSTALSDEGIFSRPQVTTYIEFIIREIWYDEIGVLNRK